MRKLWYGRDSVDSMLQNLISQKIRSEEAPAITR
jgi:hypothetical protein